MIVNGIDLKKNIVMLCGLVRRLSRAMLQHTQTG